MKFILNEEEATPNKWLNVNGQARDQESNDQQKDQKSNKINAKLGALEDPGKRLISVIKAVSKQGYEAFMNGIKGNIDNPNFPFVQLMNQPEFSTALGVGKIFEELNEDAPVDHSINGIGAGEKFTNTVRDIVNDLRKGDEKTKLGKVISNIKGRADPMTFTKFGTVYNAFVSNSDIDSDYVNDKSSIVYDSNLYRLKDMGDIERAIEVDAAAKNIGDDSKREEVKKAVSYNRVKRLGDSTKQNGTNKEEDQLSKLVGAYKSLSKEDRNRFISQLKEVK